MFVETGSIVLCTEHQLPCDNKQTVNNAVSVFDFDHSMYLNTARSIYVYSI